MVLSRTLLAIIVGCGGFFGAGARYLISVWASDQFPISIPCGTLIVNVLGALIIGFVSETALRTTGISPTTKLFITTGIMGGLTTFSTFSLESVTLLSKSPLMGIWNIVLNLFLSLIGVVVGQFIARLIF